MPIDARPPTQTEPASDPAACTSDIDSLVAGWLHEKQQRTQSQRTHATYRAVLADFRAALHAASLELDSPAPQVQAVARQWASHSKRGGTLTRATVRQRLAIVSSFYRYAIRNAILHGNPLDTLERPRPSAAYTAATALDPQTVRQQMAAIDRGTLAGKRDYALLAVALETGRRAAELAGLRWRDVQLHGPQITLTWRRLKGGKAGSDELSPPTSAVLLAWLHAFYGSDLAQLAPDAAIWVNLSVNPHGAALPRYGQPAGYQALAGICRRRLGTTRVHALRHTAARALERAGATVSEVQRRLGHASLDTTGRYLAALRRAENPHATAVAAMFGIEDECDEPPGK
jgi:integrase